MYKGEDRPRPLVPARDIWVTVGRGAAAQLKTTATVNEPLIAPIKAGQALGELTVSDGKEVIAQGAARGAGGRCRRRLVDAHGRRHLALVGLDTMGEPLPLCYLNGEFLPLARRASRRSTAASCIPTACTK